MGFFVLFAFIFNENCILSLKIFLLKKFVFDTKTVWDKGKFHSKDLV